MKLQGKRVLIFGAGVTGRAAARFCLGQGAAVSVYDDAPRQRLSPEVLALEQAGASLQSGGGPLDAGAFELAVLSPGVPINDRRVGNLREAGVEVLGEVELACRFLSCPILAITGTNGKTTVTNLLGEILTAQGKKVFVGGNVGTPLVQAVGGAWDAVVAEVSSFQLESIERFRPRVAVLLNVTDDHFDRHGDLPSYARAKARIFENQGPGDAAIVNVDDEAAWKAARDASPKSVLLPYSVERSLPVGAWAEAEDVVFLLPGRDGVRVKRGALRLPGPHNLGNALAACLAAAWAGADAAAAWGAARDFRGLAHRIEGFLEWRGIRFVDDSKGTNVDAAVRALESVKAPVVWVAGGVDKGGDYGPLVPRLRDRARCGILVGSAAPRMAEALEGATRLHVAEDWPEAVRLAVREARPGDTVLLSPACSSFDFFKSYAERGEVFQGLCREETERIDRGEP